MEEDARRSLGGIMSKWTLEKIKKQISFGDFVSIDGDDFNKRVFIKSKGDYLITIHADREHIARWDVDRICFKFFDRQGKEILPEPEYKYVNFDSFGELCEAIINKEVYGELGNKQCYLYSQIYDLPRFYKKCFKRVEV